MAILMRSRKPLRAGLLTTVSMNIGDDFIRQGLLHVVQRLAPGRPIHSDVIFQRESQTWRF